MYIVIFFKKTVFFSVHLETIQKQPPGVFFKKTVKFCKIRRKIRLLVSLILIELQVSSLQLC